MITANISGNRYIINGVSADTSDFVPDMSADIYYEVIRLIDGKVLFLHDHLERLNRSLSGTGTEYPGNREIIENLRLLIKENSFSKGNIRISLQRSNGSNQVLQCYFIPYVYPDSIMYEEGVKLITYPHQRPNPGIKKWDDRFRKSVSSYIRENGVYEAILVNSKQQITEGSRSNIFYIDQSGNLITVPEKDVLPGITRRYVLEIARKNGVHILENSVSLEELDSLVSVFISGTSPKVLPVKQINEQYFNVNHSMLRMLMAQFEQLADNNLTQL